MAADVLRRSRYPGDRDIVLLLVSELVTNAVRHAATDFELHLAVRADQVTVTVVDHDAAHPPRLRRPRPTATHGRGLQIVDQLAAAWGSEALGGDAKQVWFTCLASDGVVSDGAAAALPARGARAARPSARPTRR